MWSDWGFCHLFIYGPSQAKKCLWTCAICAVSDHPVHVLSVHTFCSIKWFCRFRQLMPWSDYAGALADLGLRYPHMPEGTFLHGAELPLPYWSLREHRSCCVDAKAYPYLRHLMTKPIKWHVCQAKTQISLVFRSLATNWAHSKDSDQTGRMPRLIWVFA